MEGSGSVVNNAVKGKQTLWVKMNFQFDGNVLMQYLFWCWYRSDTTHIQINTYSHGLFSSHPEVIIVYNLPYLYQSNIETNNYVFNADRGKI